ncbi:MAG: hypothetical protein ACI9MR_001959 [Myxococcota bacterium]|jgi:hypothetical protein
MLGLSSPAGAMPPAEPGSRHRLNPDGLYLSSGVNVGGGLDLEGDQDGLVVGGEVSIVQLTKNLWYGAYLDTLYMSNREVGRTSLGGEIGLSFVGLEVGYVAEFGGDDTFHGLRLGGVLTLAAVAIYVRGVILGNEAARSTLELGFLFKIPVML